LKLLFSAGTARGGTNLRTFLLNSHPKVALSIDAFLPLFKYFRSRVVFPELWENGRVPDSWRAILPDLFNNKSALEDFVRFCHEAQDIVIPRTHWRFLGAEIEERAALASKAILGGLNRCQASTFSQTIMNFADLVSKTYADGEVELAGFQENWIAEFFIPLSRIFPDSRFISYVRDPRAVLHSSEFHELDVKKHPAIFSMARHVRKNMSLSLLYSKLSTISHRLMITRYEDLFTDKESYVNGVVNFLEIESHPNMMSFAQYRNGEGNILTTPFDIYRDAVNNWEVEGNSLITNCAEWLCFEEMEALDYKITKSQRIVPTEENLRFLYQNMQASKGWKDSQQDLHDQLIWEKEKSGRRDSQLSVFYANPKLLAEISDEQYRILWC